MNRYYLFSSILCGVFLIYLWFFWLPGYAADPVLYQQEETMSIVVTIAMLGVMVLTLILARMPVEEIPKEGKGPSSGNRS
jgi:hypothetical protein